MDIYHTDINQCRLRRLWCSSPKGPEVYQCILISEPLRPGAICNTHDEPDSHDRTEQLADGFGAAALEPEQGDENDYAEGENRLFEKGLSIWCV